ncbi:hypothetical protein PG985_007494 [Apiospora marii]|uniref:Uncharacterized protein n=1 Tax=Apiospora marii TaxID=335849 RepID=A0ABR1SNH5_9PEZI
MAIHSRPASISAHSAIQLYKGIKILPWDGRKFFDTGRRAVPYISLRILCRVKFNSKRPGLQAVTDEHVLVQIRGGGAGYSAAQMSAPKEEVRDIVAKAFEVPKSQVGILSSGHSKARDVILEYEPQGTSFLGDQPEFYVSRARKRLEERAAKQ